MLAAAAAIYAGSEGRQIAKAAKAKATTDAAHISPSIAHQGYERPGAKKLDLHQAVNQAPCCRPSVRVDSESDHRCRGPAKYLGRPASTLGTEAAPSLIRHPDLCGFAAERPQRVFVPVSVNVRFQDAIPSRERPLRVATRTVANSSIERRIRVVPASLPALGSRGSKAAVRPSPFTICGSGASTRVANRAVEIGVRVGAAGSCLNPPPSCLDGSPPRPKAYCRVCRGGSMAGRGTRLAL